jgi:hypothetical protein
MIKYRVLVAMSCLGVCSLTSEVAQSSVTSLGSTCVEQWLGVNQVGGTTPGVVYTSNGISAATYLNTLATIVVCPVTSEQDLGTTADFKVTVNDLSSPGDYNCQAWAYDQLGVFKGASGVASSTGQSTQTLDLTITNVNPENTWAFSVVCQVPGNPSFLTSIRAF